MDGGAWPKSLDEMRLFNLAKGSEDIHLHGAPCQRSRDVSNCLRVVTIRCGPRPSSVLHDAPSLSEVSMCRIPHRQTDGENRRRFTNALCDKCRLVCARSEILSSEYQRFRNLWQFISLQPDSDELFEHHDSLIELAHSSKGCHFCSIILSLLGESQPAKNFFIDNETVRQRTLRSGSIRLCISEPRKRLKPWNITIDLI